MAPRNIQFLILWTYECHLIWSQELCRCDYDKNLEMGRLPMSSRWALNTCILTRDRQREILLWEKAMWQPQQRERERGRCKVTTLWALKTDKRTMSQGRRAVPLQKLEKLSASGGSAALPTPRFGASESNFRLLTSRNVRETMSTVLTHCACMLSHFSRVQLFATTEEPGRLLGILQARILEWVAMPSSRGSFRPRDWTHISYVSCIGRWVLYH